MKKQEMKDILEKNVLEYARYTITDRAIPNLSDGLKNIHRRIIWSMYLDKLTYDKPRTKSVNAVGSVLRFSPHGDASVYDATVRLTNDSVLYPLMDGKGSFSSITSRDVSAGAARYTEIRLAPITQELLKDIDKDIVDMVNNYDDSKLEPTDLPVTFPLILTNPNRGIAVGIASNICSFNLEDVIDNTIRVIKGEETFAMLPDFPTGGEVIKDKKVMESVQKNGTGSFKIRAKYHIEDNSIIITEIPYTTTREAVIESVISLVKNNKIRSITDINDNTGVNGLEIAIDFKRNTDVDQLLAQLFRHTPLQSTFNCNFTVLLNEKPVALGTDDIIKEWLKFRVECIRRSVQYDLDKKEKQLHILKGLEKVLLDIDKVIKIIRETKKNSEVVNNLMIEFDLDSTQAEYVADIKLRNLNEEYILDRIESIKSIELEVSDLKEIISNDSRTYEVIIDDLNRVKKNYGQPRKTTIVDPEDLPSLDTSVEVEIEDYNTRIFLTNEGYLKKVAATSLRGSSTHRLKDDDFIVQEFDSTNRSEILIFTSKYNAHKVWSYELEDNRLSQLGHYLPTLLELEKDEQILFVTATTDFSEDLLIMFENGRLARINVSAYETKQNRKVLANGFSDKSKPIFWKMIKDDIDLVAISSIDKVVLFNTDIVNSKSTRTSQGNIIMKSKDNSVITKVVEVDQCDFADIEYYRTRGNAIGKYMKKGDTILD